VHVLFETKPLVSATAHTITRLLRRGAWRGRHDAEL